MRKKHKQQKSQYDNELKIHEHFTQLHAVQQLHTNEEEIVRHR